MVAFISTDVGAKFARCQGKCLVLPSLSRSGLVDAMSIRATLTGVFVGLSMRSDCMYVLAETVEEGLVGKRRSKVYVLGEILGLL